MFFCLTQEFDSFFSSASSFEHWQAGGCVKYARKCSLKVLYGAGKKSLQGRKTSTLTWRNGNRFQKNRQFFDTSLGWLIVSGVFGQFRRRQWFFRHSNSNQLQQSEVDGQVLHAPRDQTLIKWAFLLMQLSQAQLAHRVATSQTNWSEETIRGVCDIFLLIKKRILKQVHWKRQTCRWHFFFFFLVPAFMFKKKPYSSTCKAFRWTH